MFIPRSVAMVVLTVTILVLIIHSFSIDVLFLTASAIVLGQLIEEWLNEDV